MIGSFALGLAAEIIDNNWIAETEIQCCQVIGLLGSFSTFSGFSQDFLYLAVRGEFSVASIYVVLPVLFSITLVLAGKFLLRQVLS